jgi:hypothetical protein
MLPTKFQEDDMSKLAYNFCGWYSNVEHTCNYILSIVDEQAVSEGKIVFKSANQKQ